MHPSQPDCAWCGDKCVDGKAGTCSSSVSVPAGGVGECVFVGDNAPTPAPQGEAGECANDDGTGFVPVGSRKCVKSLYGSDDSVEVSAFYSFGLQCDTNYF